MGFALHCPDPPLAALVRSMWSSDSGPPDAVMPGLIAPDAHVEFVFHVGAPGALQRLGLEPWQRLPQAMLYAQRTRCVRLRSRGAGEMIAFRASAIVAAAILRRPMHDLWDQPVDLRALLGPSVDRLVDALSACAAPRRFASIEAWLRSRLGIWSSDHARIERLHDQLVWHSDGTPVDRLAVSLGVSMRSLRRWIGEAAGMSPKQFELSGRILRACVALHERRDRTITQIAHELGFADQAAFANAFREQTSMTPRAFRAEPLVFYERAPV